MKGIILPPISDEERTPLVECLLDIIELLQTQVQQQGEKIQHLEDEILVLKGEKKRPKFKPSKLDKKTDEQKKPKDDQRPGSKKRSKKKDLKVDEDKIIQPEDIPPGSRFKGYSDFIIQEIVIKPHTVRYRLARWETPDGFTLRGKLPSNLQGHHYGVGLRAYILYQHYHCQVTQPLLQEQLEEWGIIISSGEIDRLLSDSKDAFHQEKDALLKTGLEVSQYVSVDDSGARHQGKNGYVTQIGNELFAWFQSTYSKSRINFLELLCAGNIGYSVNTVAQSYWKKQGLSLTPTQALTSHEQVYFTATMQWEEHLDSLSINSTRHRRIATEGALLGQIMAEGAHEDLVILSDDAGQFNVLLHALCWIHTERLIHTLVPLQDSHREDIARIRDELWNLYRDLKSYAATKTQATPSEKDNFEKRFDALLTQKTTYATLNQLLKRIYKNKAELLVILDRPEVPLHTNGSESDIRDYVKKRKISGGTRSALGRRCRDTFTSLKKTCRKQGISFWKYLIDRISQDHQIPSLSDNLRQMAQAIPV